MPWWEARLAPIRREVLDALCARLMEAGASGFQEEPADGTPLAYLQPWDDGLPPAPPEEVSLTVWFECQHPPDLKDFVPADAAVHVSAVEEHDWEQSWRDSVQSLAISSSLTISPPWAAQDGDLCIEPGLGFGTGEHPSTRGALNALVAEANPGESLLDVGCGSGILALAATHLGLHAEGIDIAEDAIGSARHNAGLNGMNVPFSTTPLHEFRRRFDVVVANIHAEAIVELWPELSRCPARTLILSGILEDREAMLKPLFMSEFVVQLRQMDAPWITLTLERL